MPDMDLHSSALSIDAESGEAGSGVAVVDVMGRRTVPWTLIDPSGLSRVFLWADAETGSKCGPAMPPSANVVLAVALRSLFLPGHVCVLFSCVCSPSAPNGAVRC
jgi:hypothetical protein